MISRPFTVVAIISAHNEADVLGAVLQHLIQEGISVYLLNHASTDDTTAVAEPFLGHGLLAVERFPDDRFPAARDKFAWADILIRKTELSCELDADWFIHHDADEFRESPWEGVRLVDAIQRVDRFGYSAIDFELLNFWPTDDAFQAGHDPRTTFRYYERGRAWDKLQIKCWKKGGVAPDLLSSGGHNVTFPGRRVFPYRFLVRHYPFRSQAHGERKVFRERRPRFIREELERGWHIQYDEIVAPGSFVRQPETLIEFDADAVRLTLVLEHRRVEELRAALESSHNDFCEQSETIASLVAARRQLESEQLAARVERATIIAGIDGQLSELDKSQAENGLQRIEIERLLRDVACQRREITALYASRSWRWTALLRAIYARVTSPRAFDRGV